MSDSDNPLDEERFTFQETKDGLIQIAFHGKTVTRLSGKLAHRFLNKIANCDPRERQLLMAKATGHFKHGNERSAKRD